MPPTNPNVVLLSSDPLTRTWSTDNTVTARWSGAADGVGSGLAGYAIEWSTTTTTVPTTTLTATGAEVTSPPLATGSSWWLHVRAAGQRRQLECQRPPLRPLLH